MPSLVFDIETIGQPYSEFDDLTKHILEEQSGSEAEAMSKLGLSPLTGQICAITALDADTGKGAAYFQAPGQTIDETNKQGIRFKSLTEAEILEQFWLLASHYDTFVSYNGRQFDIPFIILRSLAHRIRPSKNLMAGRYPSQQRANAVNLDLMDQLTFYGATRASKLHLVCQALGIPSPKESGNGAAVQGQFDRGEYREIAEYNLADVVATTALYKLWRENLG